MPIDASIPLSVQQPKAPDMIGDTMRAFTLKSAMMQSKQAEQQMADQQALKGVLADPNAFDIDPQSGVPIPKPETMQRLYQVSPTAAMKLGEGVQKQREAQQKQREQAMKMRQDYVNQVGPSMATLASEYEQAAQGGDKAAAWAAIKPKVDALNASAEPLAKQAGVDFKPITDADHLMQGAGQWGEYAKNRMRATQPSTPHETKLEDIASDRNKREEKRLELEDRRLRRLESKGDDGGKPPQGYEWKVGEGGKKELQFIKGGPADPDKKTGSLGNRESVFINRVMLSANEAAKDLANVVRLPTTASRGFFGGRQQGESLLAAGKETLTNKMTTQEVQSYNVRASGFQRALAAIEAAGLAPSGSLSHQMDAVIFKEGDSNRTKLEKLAQTRQIVEAGLETTLSNPKLAKAQADHIHDVILQIRKAVPFTSEDLDRLDEAQDKDPGATLQSVIKKIPTGQSGDQEGAPAGGKPRNAADYFN